MNLDVKILRRIKKYSPKDGLDQTSRVIIALAGINHPQVKEHIQRVALMAEAVALELGKDPLATFFAGLLHDTGKITQPHELFDGHNIDQDEYEEVKKHALAGFEALKDLHLFVAYCAGLHHSVIQSGYGLTVRDFPKEWHLGTVKKILEISTIISICDFIDAYTHRKTKIKDGSDKNASDLKTMLYKKYPADHKTISIALRKNKELGPKKGS